MGQDDLNRPIVIDLFCGAGGLSLGLEQAGFDIALGIDRDGHHIAAHDRNFPYGKSICASITDISPESICSILGTDDVALVCGGPPCQGFSNMGIGDASDPRNTLVDEFVRKVEGLRPRAFLMENVPGMQRGRTKAIFERCVARLIDLGYQITLPVRTLNAADYGVPQKRERLFVIGIRDDVGCAASYPDGPLHNQPPRPTVDEALQGLPRLREEPKQFASDQTAYRSRGNKALHPYAAVARGTERDPSDYSRPREWSKDVCSGCLLTRHQPSVAALYDATPPGSMVPGHKLPRLDPKGIAPTLRAGSESEHGSYTAPRPIHPYEPRCITAREAARLHGYPDWFRFYPAKWHAYRQIGNSVCPPIARALGRAILKALGERPRRISTAVVLSEDFPLPDNRLKQHRRITQVDEWPKIIEYLWNRACDVRATELVRPDFSIADVKAAYKVTSAKMPRNPPHRFLADVARSRNVTRLLEPLLARGYSIIHVGKGKPYGRFVPAGTPGTLEDKTTIKISSRDLAAAIDIPSLGSPATPESLVDYVKSAPVKTILFGNKRLSIEALTQYRNGSSTRLYKLRLSQNGRCIREGLSVSTEARNLPELARLEEMLAERGVSFAVLNATLTRRHFATVFVERRDDRLRETGRSIFHLCE